MTCRASVDHMNGGIDLVSSSRERLQEGSGLAAVVGLSIDAAIKDDLRIRRYHDRARRSPRDRVRFRGGGPGDVAQRSEGRGRALLDPWRHDAERNARSREDVDPP